MILLFLQMIFFECVWMWDAELKRDCSRGLILYEAFARLDRSPRD